MAHNLKKFTTEAEYTAATLNYPAVSWVTSDDTVHFDKTAPTPPTPTGGTWVQYNQGDSIPSGQWPSVRINEETSIPNGAHINLVDGWYIDLYDDGSYNVYDDGDNVQGGGEMTFTDGWWVYDDITIDYTYGGEAEVTMQLLTQES